MDWVNLLQDGSIVCLAIALIVDSFSIRSLRKQIDVLGKSKQDKDCDLPLIEHYTKFGDGRVRSLYCDQALDDAASRETRAASGFNPCLFRRGDSVRLRGLDGEFMLTGYTGNGFAAMKRQSWLFGMGDESTVAVSTTVDFHADRVTAWKRNTGEWPVEWFVPKQKAHKKNAAAGTCGSDKRK